MTTINRLSSVDALQPGDLIPVWITGNGDPRKASLTTLLAFIEANDPGSTTRITVPNADGYNVDVGNTSGDIWLIVNPTANYVSGSVSLPSSSYAIDGQEITVVFTASLTAFTTTSAGATVLGAPTQIGAYDSFRVRYNATQSTWYTLDTTGDGSGASGSSSIVRQQFTADGVIAAYTLAATPTALGESLQVFINGVYQERSVYTIAGAVMTFSEAPPATSTIEVLAWSVGSIGSTTANLVAYTPSGNSAVERTVENKLRESISVQDFGAVRDGITDDTPAFLLAIAAAEANRSTDVICPAGNYVLTGTIIMNTGIRLIGEGAMGAQTARGTVFTHNSNSVDMFEWDGDYVLSASGIGGGIFNAQCVKGAGFSGGTAIRLKATSSDYRPGEFTVDNVLVWAGFGGNWQRGFYADGTAANTPGTRGIRSIKLNKLRVGDCSEDNQYIYLNQVTHVVSEYLQIDTVGGTGTCGMTIDGICDNLVLGGLILNGNLIINGTTATNVALFGRLSALDINNTLVQGAAAIQCAQINNAAVNFRIVASTTDAFKVTRTTNANNVTGDGTLYKIAFDNEVYDTIGSFATDTFTASCAGQYEFNWSICLTGLLSGHTGQTLGFIHRRGGSVVESAATISNPYAQASGINYSVTGATSLKMLEGDTLELNITVAGGALVVDILGAATVYTWFAGKYVP